MEKLLDFILQFIYLFQFWRVIPVNKKGVKLRFGRNPVELDSGFHFVWPFEIDNVKTCIVEPEWGSSYPVYFTTADNKSAMCVPGIKYKIVDAVAWIYAENDAMTNLYESMRIATLDVLSDCKWDECLEKKTLTKIKNMVKSKNSELGIEIIDFGLTGMSLCRLILTKI